MKRKIVAVFLAAAMAVSMAACGSSKQDSQSQSGSDASTQDDADKAADNADTAADDKADATGDKVYNVGICQLVQHAALDAATQGFKDALTELLGDSVKFDEQNAQNEQTNCATIVNGFVANNVDLIMANATPALQSAASATDKIPILGTSVTDYATALGISDFKGTTGRNISGTSDLAPIDQQEKMILEMVPDVKKVAIVYCSAEPNSKFQAQQMEAALDKDGIQYEEFTASDSNEIQAVMTNACNAADCIYIPTDNLMAANVSLLKDVTLQYKKPMIAGESGICGGGVGTLSISYYDIGYATGKMAYEILANGADVSAMEIQTAEKVTKMYNKANCEALGMKVPDGYEELPTE